MYHFGFMIFCTHHWSQLSHNSPHTLGDKRRHSYHHAVACLGGFTLGGFLSDCPANMPRLGGPALTWKSDRSVVLCPRIQAKHLEICYDSMRSLFAASDSTTQFDYCDVYEDFHSMEEVVTEHLRKSSTQNFLYSGGMHLLISKITSDNDICFNWCYV